MNTLPSTTETTTAEKPGLRRRLGEWVQDPLGSVLAASLATMSTFGMVLSGSWLIHMALQ